MKKFKSYFLILTFMVLGFFAFGNEHIKAELNNFIFEDISVQNESETPFVDFVKDEEDVIKSGNEGIEDSTSFIKLTFSGVGEISFSYMISSEHWDNLVISVNGFTFVSVSGETSWETFSYYSSEESDTVITISYIKDASVDEGEDCCYLKDLKMDRTEYVSVLDVNLDGNVINNSGVVYYDIDNYEGVLSFNEVSEEYTIVVKLNGEEIVGDNYSYDLKNSSFFRINNAIEITYCIENYKTSILNIYYNADLSKVLGEIEYENKTFVLEEYNNEKVIATKEDELVSELRLYFEGSGIFNLNYMISSVDDFSYIEIRFDGSVILQKNGAMSLFENYSYEFYDYNEHVITISYIKRSYDNTEGKDCLYIKSLDFEEKTYVDVTNILINENQVNDGGYIVMDNVEEHKLFLGDLNNNVTVVVLLNEVVIERDLENNYYLLDELLNVNYIEIDFSGEGVESRKIVFCYYNQIIDDVFGFENDPVNPFVIAPYKGEFFVSTNIAHKNLTTSTISYKAPESGTLTIEYLALIDDSDYFVVRVNDEIMLKDTNKSEWDTYNVNLRKDDLVTISYEKDVYLSSENDCVYFKNISFEAKEFTTIAEGEINGNIFDANTKIIYFNKSDDQNVLRFTNLKETQSVLVTVNDEEVTANDENYYDLTDFLHYINIIKIVYSEENFCDEVLIIEYVAELIDDSNISINEDHVYILGDYEDSTVIMLNREIESFDQDVLDMNVEGIGLFRFSLNYFLYDLSVKICYDDYCLDVFANYEYQMWHDISYYFNTVGAHSVSIIVNGNLFKDSSEYLCLKDVSYVKDNDIISLISGDGSSQNPYDFSLAFEKQKEVNISNFKYDFYNETPIVSVSIVNLPGYTFKINGETLMSTEYINITFESAGKNSIEISEGDIVLTINYYNEGLNGSSIDKGYGSEEYPYEIYNEEQLRDVSKGLEYHYILKNDITLSEEWISIGDFYAPFTGCFNGGNFTIYNLNVNNDEFAGLFGYTVNSKIYNLNISDVIINKGFYVGSLIGFSENTLVENIKVYNINIEVNNNEEKGSFIGGLVGEAINSSFYNLEISGSITSNSMYDNSVGGVVGKGGNVSNSIIEVDVSGTGVISGVIGSGADSIVSSTTFLGDIKLLDDYILNNAFGVFNSSVEGSLIDSIHKISGVIINTEDVARISLYGQGLAKEGIEVVLEEDDSFNIALNLTDDFDNNLYGNKAGINGYVLRFEMTNGKFRYYELFDFDNGYIVSKNINIDVDLLKEYTNNFSDLEVDEDCENYTEYLINEETISSYLNVKVSDAIELEHIRYIINYGIPVSFGEYLVYGEYTSTISFTLIENLDLSNSDFNGLSNSIAFPYKGYIDGANKTIKFDINKPSSRIGAFINYYSSDMMFDSKVFDVVLEGKIISKAVSGFVGVYNSVGRTIFSNIINYMNTKANGSSSILGQIKEGNVWIVDCVNYADFDKSVFVGNYNGGSINYGGANKNYGAALNNDYKEIYSLFFGENSIVFKVDDNAIIENYYLFDVNEENVSVTINGQEYLSNEEGIISFIMNNEDLYRVIISGNLLLEKEYQLESSFRGNLVVPKNITLDPNNVLEKNSESEWILKANVELNDDSVISIDLIAEISENQLNSKELVFKNISLKHEEFIVNESVTLKRTIEFIEEYNLLYIDFVNAMESINEKGFLLKNKYIELKDYYVLDNVSQDTIDYFNAYLEEHNIDEENLYEALSGIVVNIVLKDGEFRVVYGETPTAAVLVSYLNDSVEEYQMNFDYGLEDINSGRVIITSISPFVSKRGELEIYNEYISFSVPLENRMIELVVETYLFEYDGNEKELNIEVLISDKFGDSVSNLVVEYIDENGDVVTPVDVGSYSASISFELTNDEYYNFDNVILENLVITYNVIDIVWEGIFEYDYSGNNVMEGIFAYYYDASGEKVPVELDVDTIVNAGEYQINAILSNDNYAASEGTVSKICVVNKLDLELSLGEYTITYGEELPEISIDISGILEGDVVDTHLRIVKDNLHYNLFDNLECGTYDLNIIVLNKFELEVNYNIIITNGLLTILGIDTNIIADSEVSYYYKGRNFDISMINIVLEDVNGNEISNPNFKVNFTKDGEVVSEAIDVGQYIVEIIFESGSIYNGSSSIVNLTINKVVAEIQIDNKSSYYGDEIKELTYTVVSGAAEGYESMNIVLTKEEGSEIGTYVISGSYDNPNYELIINNGIYEITKREVVILIDNKESDYRAPLQPLTYSIIFGSIIEGDELNISIFKEEGLEAGEYFIRGNYDNDMYSLSFIEGIYTINKIDIDKEISISDITKVYDGKNVDFGLNDVLLSDGKNATVSFYVDGVKVDSIVNVGEYAVKVVISNKNYNSLEFNANVVISKAENTLGYTEEIVEYEYNSNINYFLDNTKFEDGREAIISYIIRKDRVTVEGIDSLGEYVVIAEISDSLENYKSKISSITIIVVKKNLFVEYGEATFVYNGKGQYPNVTSNETLSISFDTEDGNAPADVGSYTMKVTAYSENYVIVNDEIDFEIVPLEVAYNNYNDGEYEYNSSNQIGNIKIANLVDGDDVSLRFEIYKNDLLVETIVDIGEYAVKVVDIVGEDVANYSMADNNTINITIVPKKIIVKPHNNEKVFGEDDSEIKYDLNVNLYNGDQLTGSLSREAGEAVGEYQITLGTLNGGENYELELDGIIAYYSIIPKEIRINYKEEVFYYDGDEKKLHVTVSEGAHVEYEGDIINPGTYYVKVVLDSENYCLPEDYEDILVTINKRDISDTIILLDGDFTYNGSKIVPELSCGESECEIAYFSGNEEIDSIVFPGKYKLKVHVETQWDKGYKEIEINVKKMKGSPLEVVIEAYSNRIVIEQNDFLEYRIDNGEYYSSNIFGGLREQTNYRISVRSKETGVSYASEPIIYNVSTTKSPKIIHDDIDRLTSDINENNLLILKNIAKNIKSVNVKEIDEEKYTFYLETKENFVKSMNSYEDNLVNSNKVFDFMEIKTIISVVALPMLAAFVIFRRKFNLL